jgi:D-alanyl-D-alanine carboxypeptidase (penicillin-binding protein 5/6)
MKNKTSKRARANFLLACFCLLLSFQAVNALTSPKTNAVAAILMDAKTGSILYAKNSDHIQAPASTTKIMTAILALENTSLDKIVEVCPAATAREGSSMYLTPKEHKTMRELLYGLLLVSGNDAATAVAVAVSGTETSFVQLMNRKAKLLGMHNTHFQNASGLPAYNHYSTAYDLAILTRYAMKNGNFAKIVSTKVKEVEGAKPGQIRTLINHNKLLWRYQYTTGVKTGYTINAGGCLVSTASQNGNSLISVVLKSSYIYEDSQKLLNYGFNKTLRKTDIAKTQNKDAKKS